MGVLGLFRYISKTYGDKCLYKLLGTIQNCQSAESKGVKTDWLELDLNSIFHPVAQELYQYGKPVSVSLLRPKKAKQIQQPPEEVLFSKICERIEHIRKIINPTKGIYFAIDGVAGVSKQCLTGDSLISLGNGLSKRLDTLIKDDTVFGWNGQGFTSTKTLGLQIKGEKDTLQVTMYDGRTLTLTPDHKVLIKKDKNMKWIEAGQMNIGDEIVCGVEFPLDTVDDLEQSWELKVLNVTFNMKTTQSREQSLAFVRILGFVALSSIFLATNQVAFKTRIDADMFQNDVFISTGIMPVILYDSDVGVVNRYTIKLSHDSLQMVLDIKDPLPSFLMKASCPISIIREYVAAFLGGTLYVMNDDCCRSWTGIHYKYYGDKKYESTFSRILDNICGLIDRIGIPSFRFQVVLDDKMCTCTLYDKSGDIAQFSKLVGIRYSIDTSMFLTIMTIYTHSGKFNKHALDDEKSLSNFFSITDTARVLRGKYSYNEIPYFVLPIVDIKPYKKCNVYDIEVTDNHSFLANGFCVHNCQQRKRRFKGCMDSSKKSTDNDDNTSHNFDSNSISCGTLFMERLGDCMDLFIKGQLETNPEWKNLEIIFSSHKVAGEGEHKGLAHMRQNPQFSYTIVSPDADLIFLGMGTHNPNVYIFRENIFDDIEASFFLVDLTLFRQCVLEEIDMGDEKDESKIRAIVEDFIVFSIFIGDDFLPIIPSLNVSNNGIDIILSIYGKIIKEHGFISYKDTDGSYNIRKQGMKAFLEEMAKIEQQMIIENHKANKSRYPDTILLKNVSYPILEGVFRPSGLPERSLAINFDKYRSDYYEAKFNGVEIKTIVHEYLKGMLFVLRYYLQGIPSWNFCYSFHYAAFFTEMAKHIDDFDCTMTFEPSIPLTPLEQLVAILPGKNSNLLPEPLRTLSTSSDSPIIDMYPIEFEVDLEGKKQDYEAVILLPMACPQRIRKAFKELEPQLSNYDRERNQPGDVFRYFQDNDGLIWRIAARPTF